MLTTVLIPQQVLDNLVLDPDRAYIKNKRIFLFGILSAYRLAERLDWMTMAAGWWH